jgi:hypothetical protein
VFEFDCKYSAGKETVKFDKEQLFPKSLFVTKWDYWIGPSVAE